MAKPTTETPKKRSLPEISLRGSLVVIFLIIIICVLGYFVFMKLEVKNQAKILATKEKILMDRKTELREIQKDPGYKRYQAAKYVAEQSENLNWKENTEYLISLLDELLAVDTKDRTLQLENFQVKPDSIALKGSVVAIKSMYREGGVIDKFTELGFIEMINIPNYSKSSEGLLDFSLSADIVEYEG